MITEDLKKALTELGKTSYGKSLADYLNIKLSDLADITRAAKDTFEGRQHAVKVLIELFGFLGDNLKLDVRQKPKYN